MRVRPLALLVAGLIVIGCGAREPESSSEPRPNIVLVVVDTLRRDALPTFDANAQELSNLTAFAQESFRFSDARSAASWTLPSMAAILTGAYPDRSGATGIGVGLSDEVRTLPELLQNAGYQTVGLTDDGFAGSEFFGRGFDFIDGSAPAQTAMPPLPRDGRPTRPGSALFDRSIAFLSTRQARSRPFFVLAHTYSVHDYWKVHPWITPGLPPFSDPESYEACMLGRKRCSPEQWERMKALYDAEVRWLDEGFARLLAAITAGGLANNTIVIVTSDHGEGFEPQRGRIHHGGRLHEDQLRVPLLIRIPGTDGGEVDTAVSLVDLAPTILALSSLPAGNDADGVSLMPLLEGTKSYEPRMLFAMEYFFWWDRGRRSAHIQPRDEPLGLSVMQGPDWLIEGSGDLEFYDLSADPTQRANLARSRKSDALALRGAATERRKERRAGTEAPLDPQMIERLRSLGYVD